MKRKYLNKSNNLRQKISNRLFTKDDTPIIVYLSVVIAMIILWQIRGLYDGLPQDFFIELFGVAFTLFIIDVLLVRSKAKRWKIVKDDIDYLIARGVNRLRDGLSYRAFNFEPDIDNSKELNEQRATFLLNIETLDATEMVSKINEKELFTVSSYEYFNERASDVWDIINMKYSEYLPPILVSQLINLHINLKDLCAHINQYRKSERFKNDSDFYREKALKGMANSLDVIIYLVNTLKKEGYSEPARQN